LTEGARVRDFEGKVGVVTGAARGIGLALAEAVAERGMRVVLADLEPAQPGTAAERLRSDGVDAIGVVCDVSDPVQVQALAEETVRRFGRVDLLCNNAGVVTGGRSWKIPLEEWTRVLSVNLWGAIYGIHSFVPLLTENADGGHVVNVASLAAVSPVPGIAPYNVSKHGLLALSETLQADLHEAGSAVGVTVVMPGRVATGIGLASGEPVPNIDLNAEPGIMTAESVAGQIISAVEEEKLYLFTHPDRMSRVEERFTAILHS